MAGSLLSKLYHPWNWYISDMSFEAVDRLTLTKQERTSMDRLIQKGYVRRANEVDLMKWKALKTATSYSGRLAGYNDEDIHLHRTYMVLDDFRIPSGMYGAHSADFFVPVGMAVPRDYGSHNSYYRFEDGTKVRYFGKPSITPP